MRVALISDIHGNLVALDAVLADLEREQVDQIVCLGDVAEAGPQPAQVLARLRGLSCVTVMGNTDIQLLTRAPNPPRDLDTPRVNDIVQWCADQLSALDLKTIREFPLTAELTLSDDIFMLCFHGSPRANTDFILATTPESELVPMLDAFQASIMAGGHTHTKLVRCYQNKLIVNPGSVGLPYERLPLGGVHRPRWAEYALVNANNSRLSVELRRTPVDVGAIIQAAYDSRMPHTEWWVKGWS